MHVARMDVQAVKIMDDMKKAEIAPDESTYNAVIGAFAKGGEWQEALKFVLCACLRVLCV